MGHEDSGEQSPGPKQRWPLRPLGLPWAPMAAAPASSALEQGPGPQDPVGSSPQSLKDR